MRPTSGSNRWSAGDERATRRAGEKKVLPQMGHRRGTDECKTAGKASRHAPGTLLRGPRIFHNARRIPWNGPRIAEWSNLSTEKSEICLEWSNLSAEWSNISVEKSEISTEWWNLSTE